MTNTELALNMQAEAATTELSKEKDPQHFEEHIQVAQQGGKAAEAARKQLESDLGHSVVDSRWICQSQTITSLYFCIK